MSVCGGEDLSSEELGVPTHDHYEPKTTSKLVRVLTVLAYLFSVSLAAILLSVYYVCVWKSPQLPAVNGARRGARYLEYADHQSRRGNTTINESIKNITNEVVSGEDIMLNDEEISADSTTEPEFNYTKAFHVNDTTPTYEVQDAYIADNSSAVHNAT